MELSVEDVTVAEPAEVVTVIVGLLVVS